MANIIKTSDGEKQVRSLYNTGDFFVHARYKDTGYTITHRPTAMAVCFCHDHMLLRKAKELAEAYRMVSEYVPVIDTTIDNNTLGNKDFGCIMKRVRLRGKGSSYLAEATEEIMKYEERQRFARQT